MSRPHVLVISHDRVGRHMAGPGIRYRELARVLARTFDVTLAVPGDVEALEAQPFDVWPYRRGQWPSLADAAHRADVLVAPGDSLAEFPALEHLPIPLVVDGYDPHTLETLALWSGEPQDVQATRHEARLDVLRRQCRAADFLICASERQRDWWLGQLEQAGRINPRTYGADPSLRRLVDVVPFGLPAEPPRARRSVMRGVWPGVGADDQVLLWGGGLWEWLDPLTALRAVRRLVAAGRERLRLVFPGTRHPNPDMPDMPMYARTLALADELGLAGTHVFFGDWVPYEDWPAVLLEADVGLSLHPDTVEARLAFRSRVLDYVWAGLPMVLTRGDATADLVSGHGLGALVGYGDDAAAAEAIAGLLDEPLPEIRFDAARQALTWERAAGPLVAFCREPHHAPDKGRRYSPVVKEEPMETSHPLISVIVLTWNGLHYLEDCLSSLLAQDYPAFEVIVVDNGSTDGTPEWMAEHFPDVRFIRNERNLGFAGGNNAGLRAARGDLLVLLNNDTEVHPGWLAALADTCADPAVGVAGCKLLYPDGTIQHAGGFIYGPRGEAQHVGRFAEDKGQFDQLAEVDFVTGAALAISRAALQEIGPLDEGFSPIYYEDVDWCYRARAAGYRVVYQPAAVVTHHESKATTLESHRHKFILNHGRVRFLFKHRPLEQLLDEFGPAELAWIRSLDRTEETMGARRAYLVTLLVLPGILAFRGGSEAEAEALAGLLADLRAGAVASLEALPDSPALAPPQRQPPPERAVAEAEPVAKVQPEAGRGFRAKLRRLGRALRYLDVLPDLVGHVRQHDRTFERQGQILEEHEELLAWLSSHLDRLEGGMGEQGRILQGQARDVAENIRELTALAERLALRDAVPLDNPRTAQDTES